MAFFDTKDVLTKDVLTKAKAADFYKVALMDQTAWIIGLRVFDEVWIERAAGNF